ncbi:MAG: SRPBCC domain-containing protein [Chitinophagaceae bacterium]|nr:SRPBCC domain-containing protein [Chitinophagaceae bacterium]
MVDEPFIIERTYNAPVKKVWSAITDEHQMRQWYFDIPGFEAKAGFEFQFTGGTPDGIQYIHLCKIIELVPLKKLTHSWRYKGYPGESFVTWELFAEGNKTRVKLTHRGLASFGTINPDFAKSNFIQGWTDIVGKMLPAFVESGE